MSQIETLAQMIRDSKHTVFFGGAGVSTESGIPDFRSESGLYAAQEAYGYAPEELISQSLFRRDPGLFFRYYKENLIFRDVKPNAAHRALAELERRDRLRAVVTQNIDGLHQAAGSQNVIELHGTNERQFCMSCGQHYPLDYILDPAHCRDGVVPRCAKCGGIVRPDVVLYEEGLDEMVIAAAIDAIAAADLLIVGGTSLAVYPAAGLLEYFRGKSLVLINKSETSYDGRAKLCIHDAIGDVMETVMRVAYS